MSSVNFPSHLEKSRPNLVRVFRQYWETPLREYAEQLFCKEAFPIESELIAAFEEEWKETGFLEDQIETASRQLQNTNVVQTSHHITPTSGPAFTSIDVISLSGLSSSDYYLVGAASGVAFSNPLWSGALSYGDLAISQLLEKPSSAYYQAHRAEKERYKHGKCERRISLIPSKQRDQLIYGTKLTKFQTDLFSSFSTKLKAILPKFRKDEMYSRWAAKICANIQNPIFDTDRILIFDLNQVIKRYLLKILENDRDHVIKHFLIKRYPTEFGKPFLL